jgi:hypothetical protein
VAARADKPTYAAHQRVCAPPGSTRAQ